MAKKIIGIDLNEIIRGRWQKFDQCYIQEFGEDGITEPFDTYDFRNHYEFKDSKETTKYLNELMTEENTSKISPMEYVVDKETGIAPVDSIAFHNVEETISADMQYKRFLYEDYVFEIFGAAPPLYKGVDLDIEKFYKKYMNHADIRIVSKENWFTIPSTLMFLSKSRSRFMNYHFSEKNEEIWANVDILITTDPELIKSKPEGKILIKLTRGWNLDLTGDLNKINVLDLNDNTEFEKMIGYVPELTLINENKQ